MNKFSKCLLKLGGIAGAGALCFATGGLAAPAIGSVIGSTFMGLSGAAATSAGLAALGGGSLAVGGAGMAGGTALISSVAAGLGATTVVGGTVIASGVKAKRDNEDLKAKYQDMAKNNITKQEIIKKQQEEINDIKTIMKNLDESAADYKEKYDNLKQQLDYLEEMIVSEKSA